MVHKPLLEINNLRVEFPTRHGTLVAIDDLSLHIDPGEVLGVVGESGAGKSMTGAAIIGLLEPPVIAFFVVIAAISLAYWVQFARTVRATTMVEKSKDYINAARVAGKSPTYIMFRHLLPNVMGPVLVIATISLALAIVTEATLSFLGVGVPPTQPSLGTLIRVGNDFLFSGEWWITIFPGTALAIMGLSVNLLGDWLRDALNPKLR